MEAWRVSRSILKTFDTIRVTLQIGSLLDGNEFTTVDYCCCIYVWSIVKNDGSRTKNNYRLCSVKT